MLINIYLIITRSLILFGVLRLAKVIRQHIKMQYPKLDTNINIANLDANHHAGIKANINGQIFIIGNKKMMAANGITQFKPPFDDATKGQIYVAYGQELVGQISVADPLRKGTVATIAKLQALGIAVHGLTGADEQTAQAYAKEVNVPFENICAGAVGTSSDLDGSATSKQQYIQQLQALGHKVAMVGDAANDAEAIARANIGIAVKSTIGDPSVEASAGMVIQAEGTYQDMDFEDTQKARLMVDVVGGLCDEHAL